MKSGRPISIAVILLTILVAGMTLIPNTQASTGKWRNINPTEYTSIPNVNLNSVYMLSGGTGGIGAGNGWAVGNNGTIFNWDGFSWTNYTAGTPCNLHSVNFGSPLSLPMSPISSSAGFAVGGNVSKTVCTKAIALFWNGFSWFPVNLGLADAENLTSVFITCANGNNGACGSNEVDAWAVGMNATAGTAFHFSGIPGSGGAWSEATVQGSTGFRINSVYMVSTTEGWAVGIGGKIYHYFGGTWTNPYTFGGVDFNSIFMVSSTEGWAVGTGGQISHFIGGTWQSPFTPSGTSATLRSVSCVGSSECWAVGDQATIIHFTSGTWLPLNVIQVPTLRGLSGVHGTGGSNVWAVGQTGSILMFDGSVWGSITAPLQTDINSVFMTGSSDGAAVGNTTSVGATIVRWDGVKWVRPQGSSAATDLWGVWEAGSNEWWAVGGDAGHYPYILHLTSMTSTSFTGVDSPFSSIPCPGSTPQCILLSVFGTSSSNVWAVGTGGIFAQWTGGPNWGVVGPFVPVPAGTVWRSVTFVGGDSNNGFAAGFFTSSGGGPLLYCYNNGCAMLSGTPEAWATVGLPGSVPLTTQLNSVSTQQDNSNHVWIAGSNGVILLIDGNTHTITPSFVTSSYNLTSIAVDSSTDGWAVGQDTATNLPVFVHYDGSAWTTVAISPPLPAQEGGGITGTTRPTRLQSMFLLSSTNGFAVGTTAGNHNTMLPSTGSLGMMFHLDPPGGVTAGTTYTPPPVTVTTTPSTTAASTSSSTAASTSTVPVTSTTATSATGSSTMVSTSVVTSTVVNTPTTQAATTSASSSVSTPLALPPIPGFPWESIIAGIILGMAALVIVRRRKK